MAGREFKGIILKKSASLIELLLALSIFLLAGSGIYRALSNSILVFERIKETNSELHALIFAEKISHDLRNSLFGPDFYFKGRENYLTFFIHQPAEIKREEGQSPIQKIEYIYQPQTGNIIRQAYYYGIEEPFNRATALSRVGRLSFQYYQEDELGRVLEAAELDNLPRALEVSLDVGEKNTFKTVIQLPVSGR